MTNYGDIPTVPFPMYINERWNLSEYENKNIYINFY